MRSIRGYIDQTEVHLHIDWGRSPMSIYFSWSI